MSGVPNVFGSATSSIPLSQLDVNFNTPVTIGNTTVGLGNTVTSFGNVTLTNTTISGLSGGSANGVVYINSSNVAVASPTVLALDASGNLLLNGTTVQNSAPGVTVKTSQQGFIIYDGVDSSYNEFGVWDGSTNQCKAVVKNEGGLGKFGTRTNSSMVLQTYDTERARIDTSGNFGLGVTPSGWSGRTAFQFGAAGQLNYSSGISNGGSSGYGNNGYWNGSADKAITNGYSQIVALNDNGTGRVIILTTSGTSSANASISYTAGPYVAAGGTSWTNSSDERLKNITGEIQNGLSKVCSLRAAEFTWKDDASNKPQVGLIAQDVQSVLPEVISLTTKYNSEDKTEYLGVSYTETIPLLVAAIKELSAQVTTLQTQVTALQTKVGV